MTDQLEQQPPKQRQRRAQTPETKAKIRAGLLGVKHTDERRQNIRDALTGRTLSEEHRAACGRGQTGRVVTPATRQKISEANRGRVYGPPSAEFRAHLRRVMRNRVFTEEHRENLSEKWHDRAVLTCPHCGFACYQPQYGRWHGDRCRRKWRKGHPRASSRPRDETGMASDQ
jgi:hypothetical protein